MSFQLDISTMACCAKKLLLVMSVCSQISISAAFENNQSFIISPGAKSGQYQRVLYDTESSSIEREQNDKNDPAAEDQIVFDVDIEIEIDLLSSIIGTVVGTAVCYGLYKYVSKKWGDMQNHTDKSSKTERLLGEHKKELAEFYSRYGSPAFHSIPYDPMSSMSTALLPPIDRQNHLERDGQDTRKSVRSILGTVGDESKTVLHLAVAYGITQMAEALLELGADPDIPDEIGYTPLHIAVEKKRDHIVAKLLEQGANSNVRAKDGTTPLHLAVGGGHVKAVELLAPNSDVDVMNRDGYTPLHLAAMHNVDDEITNHLLHYGANPGKKSHKVLSSQSQETAQEIALRFGHARIARRLKEAEHEEVFAMGLSY